MTGGRRGGTADVTLVARDRLVAPFVTGRWQEKKKKKGSTEKKQNRSHITRKTGAGGLALKIAGQGQKHWNFVAGRCRMFITYFQA